MNEFTKVNTSSRYKTTLQIPLEITLENIKNNSTGYSIDINLVKNHLEEYLKNSIKNFIEGESLKHFNASEDPTRVESVQYSSKVKYVQVV